MSPPRANLGNARSARRCALVLLGSAVILCGTGAGRVAAQDGGGVGSRVADAGTPTAAPDDAVEPSPDAEEAPLPEGHVPAVTLRVEPREGLVTGDLIHVVVNVVLPTNDDVSVPRQSFGSLELHAQRHRERPADAAHRQLVFELDLLALMPGEVEIPAIALRVITAEGAVGTVRTEPVRITVGSLLANEPDAQPRPPSTPVVVMEDDYTLAWLLGALGVVLVTALLSWLASRWWSRRPKAALPPPPPRPAWELALERLDSIRARGAALIEQGRQVELVDAVSDALRDYLGARYGFNGLESTTDEVLARLEHARLPAGMKSEVSTLLGDSDLVKFARAVPSSEQCESMLVGAVRVVRATMQAAAPSVMPPARSAGPSPIAAGASPVGAAGTRVPSVEPVQTPLAASVGAASSRTPDLRLQTEEDGAATARVGDAPPDAVVQEPVADAPDVRDAAGPEAGPSPVAVSASPVAVSPSLAVPAPVVLSLVLESADEVEPVVGATVLGAARQHALDPAFDGTLIVRIAADLPDDDAARRALASVVARLGRLLEGRLTVHGAPLVLSVEHERRAPQGDGERPR